MNNPLERIQPMVEMLNMLSQSRLNRARAFGEMAEAGRTQQMTPGSVEQLDLLNQLSQQRMDQMGEQFPVDLGQKRVEFANSVRQGLMSPTGEEDLTAAGVDLDGFPTLSADKRRELMVRALQDPNDPEVMMHQNDPMLRIFIQNMQRQ